MSTHRNFLCLCFPFRSVLIQQLKIKLDTPEAIAKWIEDRKKRWPSNKRIEEKVRNFRQHSAMKGSSKDGQFLFRGNRKRMLKHEANCFPRKNDSRGPNPRRHCLQELHWAAIVVVGGVEEEGVGEGEGEVKSLLDDLLMEDGGHGVEIPHVFQCSFMDFQRDRTS